jgi:hypothetical protein
MSWYVEIVYPPKNQKLATSISEELKRWGIEAHLYEYNHAFPVELGIKITDSQIALILTLTKEHDWHSEVYIMDNVKEALEKIKKVYNSAMKY